MNQNDGPTMGLPSDEENLKGWFFDEKEEKDFWLSWMTTQEAAALSGYDVEHVRRSARQGKIGAVKRGRDWWIEVDVFLAYLESMIDSEDKRAGPKGEPEMGGLRKPLS
jgi:excisionase family DNA binding protein